MAAKVKYKVGQRFNSWTLLEKLPKVGSNVKWVVICDCGVIKESSSGNITNGASKMCLSCAAKKRWQEGRGPK